VSGVNDDSGAQEKTRFGQSVHEDEQRRAGHPGFRHDRVAEEDVTDLADRRIGEDSLKSVSTVAAPAAIRLEATAIQGIASAQPCGKTKP